MTVEVPDINRPVLQLAGFFDHFETDCVQVIGNVVKRPDNLLLEKTNHFVKLARYISIHEVLADVYGVGVLIMGERKSV